MHFQGTEQLINALVAAGKPFQMMEYPNRTHGIYEGAGTTQHLFNLLTRYLEEHLPAGGRPQGRGGLRRRAQRISYEQRSRPSTETVAHSTLHPAFNSLYHASNARGKNPLLNSVHSPSDAGSVNAAPASAAGVPAA